MGDGKALTKSELLYKMREHQAAYTEYAQLLKKLSLEEEEKNNKDKQLLRLQRYKEKYKLYVKEDGVTQVIDWDEVTKLITSSLESKDNMYMLGFNSNGDEGLFSSAPSSGIGFTPMVEEESDAKKLVDRLKRKVLFEQASKNQR